MKKTTSKTYAIILAGGKGLRLNKNIPKQFLQLANKPIILRSIETFAKLKEVDNIIITSPEDELDRLNKIIVNPKKYKILKTIIGGTTRQKSSYNAVNSHNFNDNDILLFHDAARPFIGREVIIECIGSARKNGAAGVYVPTTDTITEINGDMVIGIIPRNRLYNTQTPQSFLYHIIYDAHKKAENQADKIFTDDASIVIDAGYNVIKVEGDPANYKITSNADFEFAKWQINKMENE